ncbi:MAG: SatD family protein [Bacillota bacterium]
MSYTDEHLHIEKLKEKFKDYKRISVKDFYEFYKEVFEDVNKNTVSWYIYDLKEKNIIRNIARGQYVLVNNGDESSEDLFAVITMDIIKSTDLDYRVFNDMLKKKINKVNEVIEKRYSYEREYNISQGDEIQILIPFDKDFINIIMLTLSYLYPLKARYGISIGKVDGEIKKNSWDMNAPIFWNARDQLEKINDSKEYDGRIASGYNNIDKICNNILPLINRSIAYITEKQWKAIQYRLALNDYKKAINAIGISKSSYYDRLKASSLEEILSSFKAIYEMIKMRRDFN